MKRIFLLCYALVFSTSALAQTATSAPTSPTSADSSRTAILSYISGGWDTLSRSMSDCHSVADTKVTTTPVLYLPAGMATPPEVETMQKQCNVDLRRLPRRIRHIGDLKVEEVTQPGLLYLPNRYVVPGGRFNEMYGWDSYFIILGLVADGHTNVAQGIVENFFFEIENYGAVLNANRTYYLTRSQPPFLTSMIRAVYDDEVRSGGKADANKWLARAYGYAKRDHELWVQPLHAASDTGLARYEDIGEGPVPEMADDNAYYSDVIRWLAGHPDAKTDYLVNGTEDPDTTEADRLAKTSCDPRASKVCAHAWFDGHRLSQDYFKGDRAMRESGFDVSFRFGPFSGSTNHYAPVCLNSLLYKYERDMAAFATTLGKTTEAAQWNRMADKRRDAVNRLMWNAEKGLFYDYDYTSATASNYDYVTSFYPLWAGLATKEQAAAVQKHLSLFEHSGGLAMSDVQSGMQWDEPFGWAPTNWIAAKGLLDYGYSSDAMRIADKFMSTVRKNFATDGTIREKYNMLTGSSAVQVSAGYKSNVVGFGWTNGVYLQMNQLLLQKQAVAASAQSTLQ